jgi:hypothetical protein
VGPFMVGVHKNISHPKITLKTLLWWPLHIWNNLFNEYFLITYSCISWLKWWWFFAIWMIKMYPQVPWKWLKNCVPWCNFIKKDSIRLTIFVQIASYSNHKENKVCFIWWHSFQYDKSSRFVELMLESLDFSIKGCVNKNNQIDFVNYKFTFQRFGKKYRCGC